MPRRRWPPRSEHGPCGRRDCSTRVSKPVERGSRGFRSQGILALALRPVRVDRGAWEIQIEEVVVDEIGRPLRVDEDDGTGRREGEQQIVEGSLLLVLLDPDDLCRPLRQQLRQRRLAATPRQGQGRLSVQRTCWRMLTCVLPGRPTRTCT